MPKLVIGGDAKAAVKANLDLAKALDQVAKEGDKVEKKLNKTERAAKRIKEAVDPAKRYNRQLKETAKLAAKGAISLEDAQRRAAQLRKRLDGVGKVGKGAFSSMGREIASTLTGIASFSAAISSVRNELAKQRQVAEAGTQAQLSVAQAEQNLRQNIFSFPKSEQDKLLQGIPEIAKRANLPLAPLLQAATANVSGTGDPKLTLKLIDIASQFTRDAGAIKDIAGGLGDVAFTSGIKNPKEALGFLTLTQSGARLEEAAAVGKEVGKVLASFTVQTTGSDAATGAALLASLSKGIADPTGQLSRTAAVNLIDRSKKFFRTDSVAKRFQPDQINTFNEQLQLLFSDKKLGKEFVDTASFRAASKGGIAKLILGDPQVRGAFETTRKKLATPENRIAFAEQALQFVNAGELQKTSRAEGAIQSRTERFRLGQGATLSQERETELLQLLSEASRLPFSIFQAAAFARAGTTFSREEAVNFIDENLNSSVAFQDSIGRGTKSSREATELLKEIRDELRKNAVGPIPARQE